MHGTDLIAATLTPEQREPLPEIPERGVCCVTGRETDTILAKHILSSSFCDRNLLACPGSDRIGVNVWYAWLAGYYAIDEKTGKPKTRKKKPEMQACWFCDGVEFNETAKADTRRYVLAGVPRPDRAWSGWVTTSYKKHGSLRAPVNRGVFGGWGFDDLVVDASDNNKVCQWWTVLRQAQTDGIGRKAMEVLEMPLAFMEKIGFSTWLMFESWARPQYQSALYQFLVYLLPSQQELKEGYADALVYD